jgi:hypothetical protein
MAKDKSNDQATGPQQALIPALPENGPIVLQPQEMQVTIYATTYPMADPQTRFELMSILMEPGEQPEDWINIEFTLQHITIFPRKYLPKKDGEEIEAIWSVITTTEGRKIAFHSQGILQSLRVIMACSAGMKLPDLGKFKLSRRKTGESHAMYILERVK